MRTSENPQNANFVMTEFFKKFGALEEWCGAKPVAFCAALSCTPNGYRNPRRSIYAQPGTLDQEVLRRRYAGVRLGGLLPGILLAFPIHNLPLGVAWLFEPPAGIRFLARALKVCHAPERFQHAAEHHPADPEPSQRGRDVFGRYLSSVVGFLGGADGDPRPQRRLRRGGSLRVEDVPAFRAVHAGAGDPADRRGGTDVYGTEAHRADTAAAGSWAGIRHCLELGAHTRRCVAAHAGRGTHLLALPQR